MSITNALSKLAEQVGCCLNHLNHNRLRKNKIKKCLAQIKALDKKIESRKNIEEPTRIKSILIIDPLYCFGDAVFVNGLLNCFVKEGLDVSIMSRDACLEIYKTTKQIKNYFDYHKFEDRAKCREMQFNCILDLQYIEKRKWTEWGELLAEQKTAFTLVCSEVLSTSKLYSDFVNLTSVMHFSERMNCIAERILKKKVSIFPVLNIAPATLPRKQCIYVNTVGGRDYRSLSEEQIKSLIDWFENQEHLFGLFYVPKSHQFQFGKHSAQVQPESFIRACEIVSSCIAVVSPDTSIVHVASAFNKPIVAFYCSNDPEAYEQFEMVDVWGPLSQDQMKLLPHKNQKDFWPKRHSIKEIPISDLITGMEWLNKTVSH